MKKINDLKVRVASFALSGAIILTTLTGCSNNNKKGSNNSSNNMSLLSGTIFEDASVMTFEDGHKDIVTVKGSCGDAYDHKIYQSVKTNEYFSISECAVDERKIENARSLINHYDIEKQESLINYLTSEEIAKLSKNEITSEELATILDKILNSDNTKSSSDSDNSSDMNLLSGTIFEDASVMTFEDGHKDIVTVKGTCGDAYDHKIYKSVITNEYFSISGCAVDERKIENTRSLINHYDIEKQESLTDYLTFEEIEALSKNEITSKELAVILDQVLNSDNTKNSNVKTKNFIK